MSASRESSAVALASVGALSAAMLAPAASPWTFVASAALLAWALSRRLAGAAPLALFAALWSAVAAALPWSRVWPWKLAIPLLLFALAAALKGVSPPLRLGRLDAEAWRWVLAIAAVSGAALVLWTRLAEPDLSRHLAHIPGIPRWSYPLAAVVFAAGNAALEEATYRGVIFGALERTLGRSFWPVAVQALAFAAAHYLQGFPSGVSGFALVLVYGLALGLLCRRSGGLLAPWAAHVGADLTIFALVAAVR